MTRSEEELHIRKVLDESGRVRLRKEVEESTVEQSVDVRRERVDIERVPADPDDDGEVHVIGDGSLSIPLWREEIVVSRRWVVGERVIARKRVETVEEHVSEPVRRERVTVSRRRSRPLRSSKRRDSG